LYEASQFLELPVIGLLLLAGLSPLFACFSSRLRASRGPFRGLERIVKLPERGIGVTLLLVVALLAGIVGNALVDSFVNDSWAGWKADYGCLYELWRAEYRQSGDVRLPYQELNQPVAPTLKAAEHAIGNGNHEYSRAYLLRHKALLRVLRAAAVAAICYVLSAAAFEILRRKLNWNAGPFSFIHFAVAILVVVLLTTSYFEEVADVHKRIFGLYTNQDASQFKDEHPCYQKWCDQMKKARKDRAEELKKQCVPAPAHKSSGRAAA
jgi:hypothetical protein